MARPAVRPLPEEFLALALRDSGSMRAALLRAGLGGALLAELALTGRIEARGGRMRVVSRVPLGYEPCDRALASIGDGDQPVSAWLRRQRDDARHGVADQLVRAGLLRCEDKSFGPFRWRVYPAVPGPARDALLERLREAVAPNGDPDERAATLAMLLSLYGIVARVLPGTRSGDVRRRMKELREFGYVRHDVRAILDGVRYILRDTAEVTGV